MRSSRLCIDTDITVPYRSVVRLLCEVDYRNETMPYFSLSSAVLFNWYYFMLVGETGVHWDIF